MWETCGERMRKGLYLKLSFDAFYIHFVVVIVYLKTYLEVEGFLESIYI